MPNWLLGFDLIVAGFYHGSEDSVTRDVLQPHGRIVPWKGVQRCKVKVSREAAHLQNGLGTKWYGPFDSVFEFPDIAQPIVVHQTQQGVF
jgi:hypothetical protein